MIQIKSNIIIIIGIFSVVLSMIIGLLENIRPETILIRTFLGLLASVILSFFGISMIEKFIHEDQTLLQKPKESDKEKDNDVSNSN